ncbi:MAG: response regulator [Lachnospiraceae bacterium]|nr:response regulator [Lachnospiraceae bacterium]
MKKMMGKPTADGTLFSMYDAWALAFGCIIGWGAFIMPGTTFLPEAGVPGTAAALGISSALMLVIAYNFAYMMGGSDELGGPYAYALDAFGFDSAFLCSWFLCLSYLAVIPINATALPLLGRILLPDVFHRGFYYEIAGYAVYLNEAFLSELAIIGVGLFMRFNTRLMRRLQTFLAVFLAAGILVFAAAAVLKGGGAAVFPHLSVEGSESGTLMGIFAIILLSPWAFVGFDTTAFVPGSFRSSSGKVFLVLGSAIFAGGLSYFALTFISSAVYGIPVPAGTEDASSQLFIRAAEYYMGPSGTFFMVALALAAVLTGLIGFFKAGERLLTVMAEGGILPRCFREDSFSILFLILSSSVLSFFGRTALGWIVDMSSFGAVAGYGFASAAVWKRSRGAGQPKSCASGAAGTLIALFFAVFFLVPGLLPVNGMAAESYLFLACWSVLGYIFYWRTMQKNFTEEGKGVVVSPSVLFFLIFFSSSAWSIMTILGNEGQDGIRNILLSCVFVQIILILAGTLSVFYSYQMIRKKQQEMERRRIEAEAGSKAKSRLLFSVSHDLRTPMNAILGYTRLAQRDLDDREQVRHYLDRILKAGGQLLTLVDDVLEMSRLENGRFILTEEPCDLHEIVEDVRYLFEQQMEEKGLHFSIDESGVLQRKVSADKIQLIRILSNLLSNALKFTPAGGCVSLSVSEREDGFYVFSVKDDGIGMSEEFAAKVFEAFERERTSTESKLQGSGLGMSITKNIVEKMKGRIRVHTAPGKGTEFVVELPLEPVAEEAPPEAEPEEAEAEPGPESFQGKRILLAEDNEINREIAEIVFSDCGFEVETAENGKEALEMLKEAEEGRYDLVLMDIQMPVMNGYEAARAIRELEDKAKASIPIVAMTANVLPEDVKNALEAGMCAHIAKPLDIDEATSVLRKLLY